MRATARRREVETMEQRAIATLRELVAVDLSADEARLMMVGTNPPAMARTDAEPGKSLHGRCDRMAKAQESARRLLAEVDSRADRRAKARRKGA